MMSNVVDVRIEHYMADALGIGTGSPRLSWSYTNGVGELEGRNAVIRIERISPALHIEEERVTVPADQNLLLDWPFAPAHCREQIKVYVGLEEEGGVEDWSAPRMFEPGFLETGERIAEFVSPAWPEPWSDYRQAPLIRGEKTLRDTPVSARLYLSALGLVEAQINGHRIGEDILTPGWTLYDKRVQYRTYDVTKYLHKGDNALGFWLGDGWYRGRLGFWGGIPNLYGDRLALFAQVNVTYADGSEQRILSNAYDGKWKARKGPIVFSGLCEGEHYDARLEETGWSEPGFDDSGWERVTRNPYDVMNLEAPELDPIRRIGEHPVRSIKKIGDGGFIVDFGQNCSQRLELNLHGFQSGDTVTIQHAEVLESDGELSTRPLRRGVQTDTYISNGQDAVWEPKFTIHGFRYARIDGWKGELTDRDLRCYAYGSQLRRTGWLHTSNDMVNALHSNVNWSMRSNFVSIPTDCPQRDERMGWTGDISLFAPTASFLYDTEAFLSNWLIDVETETRKWGTTPYYVPFVPLSEWRKPQAIAIWNDCTVLVPWALYMASGDVDKLRSQYPLAKLYIDEVAGYLSDDGVWDHRPDLVFGQLGDWLDPTAPPDDAGKAMTAKELVATAFYARSVRLFARMAAILGNREDREYYSSLADHVREGFIGRFFDGDGHMTSDTQCAYTLAIEFGLLDERPDLRLAAGERLAQLVRDGDFKVGTGFAGTPYLLPALTDTGHTEEAYRLFLSEECPSWMYQVKMGATTTWERWDSMRPDGSVNPSGMTSFNHYSLGSVADWMHSTIGGLSPISAGWKEFRVKPEPGGGITSAQVAHETPYGRIDLDWKLSGDELSVRLIVPAGTHASAEIGGTIEQLGGGLHEFSCRL